MLLNKLIRSNFLQSTVNFFPTFHRTATVKNESGFSDKEVEQFKIIFDK